MEQPRVPGFVIQRLLGRGSSGAVWLAVREHDHRQLAVKVVDASGPDAEAAAAQARREWAVLSRVDNPHLVRLHAALPLDDWTLALVLDLADGGSLASVVAGRGHLSPGETVTVLAPVARAVADLHAAGVVHADLSPGNVLLTADGRPMVGDLGVARIVGERPEHVYATAGYVAPEVAAGGVPGPEADVHAVGALAWLALTGAAPPPAAIRPPLTALAPATPAALARVVTACLSADPAQRPAADQVAVELFDATPAAPVRLAHGADPAAGLTHRIRVAAAAEAPEPVRRRGRLTDLPAIRRTGLVAGAAVGLAALLAAGGWWLASATDASPGAVASGAPRPSSAQPGPTSSVGARPTSTPSPTDPAPRPTPTPPRGALSATASAVRKAPRALVQELADARARAYASRDTRALGAVDVPGSAALASDAAFIAALRSRGFTYAGLSYRVHDVRVLHADATHATVRACVDTSGYARTAGGVTDRVAARPGTPLTLTLRWTSRAWRIERIG